MPQRKDVGIRPPPPTFVLPDDGRENNPPTIRLTTLGCPSCGETDVVAQSTIVSGTLFGGIHAAVCSRCGTGLVAFVP